MIQRLLLPFVALLFFSELSLAQGQFKHMQYNLTLYGNPFGCDESSNNTAEKDAALTEIIAYAQPDIFCVNELRDQDQYANRILNQVLNAGDNVWSRAALSAQFTWSSIVNGFFYREDKFTLYNQEVVYQALDGTSLLRPIDLYTIYIDSPGLLQGDTTFITCVVAHLAATDPVERADQTEALMVYLHSRGPANYIFSGDLNMDSSTEAAFQNLINDPMPSIEFIDPISVPTTWHNNPSVAGQHTQSTRFSDTNGGCFSGGGLDDRFDITLISPSVQSGSEGVQFIPGTYKPLGQNGNDFNQALQVFNNGVVPDNVAQALYDMSDHLPLISSYTTDITISVDELALPDFYVYEDGEQLGLMIGKDGTYRLRVFDMEGRIISDVQFTGKTHLINRAQWNPGMYIVQVAGEGFQVQRKTMKY